MEGRVQLTQAQSEGIANLLSQIPLTERLNGEYIAASTDKLNIGGPITQEEPAPAPAVPAPVTPVFSFSAPEPKPAPAPVPAPQPQKQETKTEDLNSWLNGLLG